MLRAWYAILTVAVVGTLLYTGAWIIREAREDGGEPAAAPAEASAGETIRMIAPAAEVVGEPAAPAYPGNSPATPEAPRAAAAGSAAMPGLDAAVKSTSSLCESLNRVYVAGIAGEPTVNTKTIVLLSMLYADARAAHPDFGCFEWDRTWLAAETTP